MLRIKLVQWQSLEFCCCSVRARLVDPQNSFITAHCSCVKGSDALRSIYVKRIIKCRSSVVVWIFEVYEHSLVISILLAHVFLTILLSSQNISCVVREII